MPKIPPNAHIVYEVEILSVEPGKEGKFAEICLILEAKFGDDPLLSSS